MKRNAVIEGSPPSHRESFKNPARHMLFSEGDEHKNRQENEQCNIEPLTPHVSQDTLRSPAFPIETLVSLLFIVS